MKSNKLTKSKKNSSLHTKLVKAAQTLDKKLPIITIIKTEENADGSLNITFEYGKEFENVVKTSLGKNKVSKEDVGNYFTNILKKAADKEDGYDLKHIKD